MAVGRLLIVPLLAGLLATPLSAPLQADGGVDATGQVLLRFNFGDSDKVRDAGPRFGLRLGALPEPEPGAAAPDFTEDFTSALGLEFDGQGQGELSLGGIAMLGIGDSRAEHDAAHAPYDTAAVLGYAPAAKAAPRQLEAAPLVTAAGPARAAAAPRRTPGQNGTESLWRQAAADASAGAALWAFRPVQPAAQAMGPRFRRLAASLLERRHGAAPPLARPADAAVIAGAPAATARWQFHAIEATAPAAAGSSPQDAIAGYATLLLAPHGQSARPDAVAMPAAVVPEAGPLEQAAAASPGQAAGLVVGQWIFRELTGDATG